MSVSSTSFYYAEGETPQGPFSAAHILSLKSLGKISDETYVIQAGGTEWTTFVALQPTLKSLLPGPVISSQSPHPNPVAVATSVRVEKEASPAKLEVSPTKATALEPNASFTEQMLALANELGGKENLGAQLFKIAQNADEEILLKIVPMMLSSGYEDDLMLDNITSLSVELAELLSRLLPSSWLSMRGLNDLEPQVAKILAKRKGILLLGGGFNEISEDTAKALSTNTGHLCLTSLELLTPEIARILSTKKGRLDFDALSELSASTAAAFSEANDLGFGGLTALSVEAATALSKHKGMLALQGLESLSLDVAECLAKRSIDSDEKDLKLSTKGCVFNAEFARVFQESNQAISYNYTETISFESLEAFSKRKRKTSFCGFEYLSPKAISLLTSGMFPNLKVNGKIEDIEIRE